MNATRDRGAEAEVLLVEDHPADAWLISQCIAQVSDRVTLHRVADGDEALAFLRERRAGSTRRRPDLMLLDLNLPGRHGSEVLAEVKADEELSRMPVVVLTSSTSPEDINRIYRLHANSYVPKSVDPDAFGRTIMRLAIYWLSTVVLPTADRRR